MFDDLLDANRRYRTKFHDPGVAGTAAKGLAVLTCIDSRVDPLALLEKASLDPTARAEDIAVEGFVALARGLP